MSLLSVNKHIGYSSVLFIKTPPQKLMSEKTEYRPIENYGIIGDLNTIALVGLNGSIDYMCFPYFDSPSIFAALLDSDNGGSFSICPRYDDVHHRQLYFPDTNVLLTRFLSSRGIGEITDFMPVEELYDGHVLVRRVTNIVGSSPFVMKCQPRFNYARSKHEAKQIDANTILFSSKGDDNLALRLRSTVELQLHGADAYAEFTIKQGKTVDFVLELFKEGETNSEEDISAMVDREIDETMSYWKEWSELSQYNGRWRETVNRSALLLKLLTSHSYGSVVAAPTFSLPEHIGGTRNWDYRYTWIRDSSFTLYNLIHLGYVKEAENFMKWIQNLCQDIGDADKLKLMYTIDGKKELDEKVLDHMEGYKGSSPVRIGNNAHTQLQLDIYGELMDAVYLFDKYCEPISYDFWKDIAHHIDWIGENWDQPDEGIWEVRGGKKKFLHSRLMCWVAVDRAIKLCDHRSFPMNPAWKTQRDNIFESIYEKFWNEERQTFVQYEGANNVDAAILLMPLVRFISPSDPKWLSTLKAIEEELITDSLVYRYRHDRAADDGFNQPEGAFSMCSFWYIECLSRAGQLQKARLYFEKMIGYCNHVGLYAEQLGFKGEHLGNFPQAFTHLGLISAAINLNKQLDNMRNKARDMIKVDI